MRNFHKSRPEGYSKSRLGHLGWTAAAGALLLAVTAAAPEAVGQAGPPDANNFQICSSVKGADCLKVPGPNTPIPKQFQESYNVYLKMKAAAHGGTQYTRADYAKMPDWSGIWTRGAAPGKRNPGLKFDGDQPGDLSQGQVTAQLTPKFEEAYREKLKQVKLGNEWDQLSDCLPSGFPRWLTEPFLREYIVAPGETRLINEQQSEVRRIYTDGRGHVAEDEAKPLWTGDSIGFWDGDTLVVHTIRVTHGQYQRENPDYSESTSTVERIRMINPNLIQYDVTVWDPKGLKAPWHVMDYYSRVTVPGSRIDQWSCEQNNNVVRTKTGSSQFILPGETVDVKRTYRDPNTFYLTDAQKKAFADEINGN
ncbi:MAG: hypothetical protein ACXWLT_09460 [Rhizomicrobium sp.]